MTKQVIFGKEAKDRLLEGVNIVANAVTTTMGIGGRNVVFDDEYGNLRSTKDGVTVAKMISDLKDPVQDFGARLIKAAAIKTANVAGDGTTTATLLTQYITNQAIKAVQNGANAVEVKRGVEKGLEFVLKNLKQYVSTISSQEDLEKVATLSANGDVEIGKYISEAINTVGRDGIVSIEETKFGETRIEIVEGIQWNKGLLSPYLANDDKNSKCVLDDAKILLYDKVISRKEEILPILEYSLKYNKSMLIVAEDIVGEALSMILLNKNGNNLKICPVKADQFGEKRKEFLQDLAIITNAQLLSYDMGDSLMDFRNNDEGLEAVLGECRRVEVKSNVTTIIDSKGLESEIVKRGEEIKYKLDNAKSQYEKEYLQKRLGNLVGSVAIINIHAHTEVELKERKDRAEDALFATYCALDEGVINGGGVPLFIIANNYANIVLDNEHKNEYQKIGFEILTNNK